MGIDPESSPDEWEAPNKRFGDVSGKEAIFFVININHICFRFTGQ